MFINKLNMIHHIVYRTTDVTTGEYYIGFHSYDDQDPPSYFGSYKQETHWEPNEDNLIRETLMEFSSRDEAREAEPGFIQPHLDDPLCQNLHATMMSKTFDRWCKPAETHPMWGKSSAMKGRKHTDESREKMSKSASGENNSMWGKPGTNLGKKFTIEHRMNISKNHVGMKGKKHSPETIQKMKESAAKRKKLK